MECPGSCCMVTELEDIGAGRAAKLGLLLHSFCYEQSISLFFFFCEGSMEPLSLVLRESSALPSPQDLGEHGPFYNACVVTFLMHKGLWVFPARLP